MNALRIARDLIERQRILHNVAPRAWAVFAATLVAVLGVSATQASTVVRLQTDYENHQVSESYVADLDEVYQEMELARSADGTRTGWHYQQHQQHVSIVDVGSHVYSDYDHDGYFTHFSLSFDIDAGYGSAWVYARIYLRDDTSDYTLFHTTEVFEIYNNLGSDRYKVESKLVANYPAAHYDLLIEVFVAGDPNVRDVVDASTHQNLFALPLESDRLDDGPRDVIIHGSVGSSTLGGLAILGFFAIRRRIVTA